MRPRYYYINSGSGVEKSELVSFDSALSHAGISNYNLVRVSSILPGDCVRKDAVDEIPGSILYTAYGSISSSVEGETIASAICIGLPKDEHQIGVIMEFSGVCTEETARKKVLAMTKKAMSNHNIPCRDYLLSSAWATAVKGKCTTVISAVAMW
ncbi:MAG: arginine decarboxylase, pyruvoyl-dependent [Lachnospiraceae bacterium]|nr:arginine decarboxylase, pyruvoyl-dependent [Lachnospiraceae bacterium]